MKIKNRTIFTEDCLKIMRGMADECIDLIYLDPPFNSSANYAAPIGSMAAGAEFKDTWGLNDIDLAWYGEIADKNQALYELLTATQSAHGDSMMSYLIYMAIRTMEMKRILKETGSIYLHCDPTASHYLKLMLDCVFGKANFRNEIIWHYKTGGTSKKWFGRKHDVILFYSKSGIYTFNSQKEKSYLSHKYGFNNIEILRDKNGYYRLVYVRDVWNIPALRGNQAEATGYPTQKPVALLKLIIKAGSNKDDFVLDPFCGCATACIAAEIESRQWIGIDVSSKAFSLVKERLEKEVAVSDYHKNARDVKRAVIPRTDIPSDRDGKKSKDIKHVLYGKQEGACTGCLVHFPFRNMTLDHIVPLSAGGPDSDSNIQLLCGACNSKKGARLTQEELVARLVKEKVRPY